MKRSPFSVAGVLVLLAGLASTSAQAQPFTITKTVPSTVAPVTLSRPAQAYAQLTTFAGVPGRRA